MQREQMQYDVVIVGAGPAGLSAAIRLKQLANAAQHPLSICVLEKGAEVGAHILSGAVLEPSALNELLPDWQNLQPPSHTAVTRDTFSYLTKNRAWRLPTPATMKNHGNWIISLGQFCRWLASQAESLGVEIYAGFPASEILYDQNQRVIGVATGDMGLDKHGQQSERYQPGMEIHAKQTIFAEGCHGSLSKTLIEKFSLDKKASPQTYGIGLKELWHVDAKQHRLGEVTHTVGWPLDKKTYGGSFIYHLAENKVAVGFVIGLDYQNAYLNPYAEFQRFKNHPAIRKTFAEGQRLAYGARALVEGGWQSLPQLAVAGGVLIGDSAGFLNVAKIKGTHTAMKSAMLAAEEVFAALKNESYQKPLDYRPRIKNSWLEKELHQVRNIRPSFHFGLLGGLLYSAFDQYLLRGHAPWTLKNHADHQQLKPIEDCKKIDYPKPDGQVSFELLSSVYLSNTNHQENQPCHLQLAQTQVAINTNLKQYDSPESRYCPAGVYEIVYTETNKPHLQINAQNCLHCKTCDIKDPTQNITWLTPEGGGGPNYGEM